MSAVRWIGALAVVIAVAAPSRSDGAGRPRWGGTLRAPLEGELSTLDPARAETDPALLFASLVHQPLFAIDADGSPRPVLLSATETSRDGLGLVCVLDEAARFHDGRPVHSEDVRYSLARLATLDARSVLAVVPALLEVRVRDELRFELRFKAPVSPATVQRLLALPQAAILPEGVPVGAVGAGPFILEAGGSGADTLVLGPNLLHRDGRPFLDRLELVMVTGASDEVERFFYGQLDMTFRESPRLEGLPGMARVDGPSVESIVLVDAGPAGRSSAPSLARALRADRLLRYIDRAGEPATALRPGLADVGAPRGAHGFSGPLVIGYRPPASASEPIAGDLDDLGDLASAIRDAANQAGATGSRAIALTSGTEQPDVIVERWRWLGDDTLVAAAQTLTRLGAPIADVRNGVVRSAGTDERWARRVLADVAGSARVFPLIHLRRAVWVRGPFRGVRFRSDGVLDLANTWREDGR